MVARESSLMPPLHTQESTPARPEDHDLAQNLLLQVEDKSILHTVDHGGHDPGQRHHHLIGGGSTPGGLAPDPDLSRHQKTDESPQKNLPLTHHHHIGDEIILGDLVPALNLRHTPEEPTTPVRQEGQGPDHLPTAEDLVLKTISHIGTMGVGGDSQMATFIKVKKQHNTTERVVLQLPKSQVVETLLIPTHHPLAISQLHLYRVDRLQFHHKCRQTLKNSKTLHLNRSWRGH